MVVYLATETAAALDISSTLATMVDHLPCPMKKKVVGLIVVDVDLATESL
jgi:hypothetical protein